MKLNNNEVSDITWNQCHYAHKNDESEDLLEELYYCEYAEFESVVRYIETGFRSVEIILIGYSFKNNE